MKAQAVLDDFWNSTGETTFEQYTEALAAAFDLGNRREFANVLCEVSTAERNSALEIVMTVMQHHKLLRPSIRNRFRRFRLRIIRSVLERRDGVA